MAHAVDKAASACRRRKAFLRETRHVHDHTPVGLYSSLFTVENAVEGSPGVGRKVIVRITPYAHEAW